MGLVVGIGFETLRIILWCLCTTLEEISAFLGVLQTVLTDGGEQFSGSCERGTGAPWALQELQGAVLPFLQVWDQPQIQQFHPQVRMLGMGQGTLWHSGHRCWQLPVPANWAGLEQDLNLCVLAPEHWGLCLGTPHCFGFESQYLAISALFVLCAPPGAPCINPHLIRGQFIEKGSFQFSEPVSHWDTVGCVPKAGRMQLGRCWELPACDAQGILAMAGIAGISAQAEPLLPSVQLSFYHWEQIYSP